MFYRSIQIPSILAVGSDLLPRFEDILRRNCLYFQARILVTEEALFDRYKWMLRGLQTEGVRFVESSDITEVYQLEEELNGTTGLVIGFGGGKVLDVVKLFADRDNRPYISIPSALSHDGIYSPVARLTEGGRKRSFGVKPPVGIVADLDVIAQAPALTTMAGVGDLVSNLSALSDWRLAQQRINEPINDFAYTLSLNSADSIISCGAMDLKSKEFLQRLAYGLVMSGLAMVMAGSSRPCSGAEHLISHSIDELFPEKSTLHGLQVAWGHLLVEKAFRRNNSEVARLEALFTSFGLLQEIRDRINLSDSEVAQALQMSLKIRNRYTVLNENAGRIMDWPGLSRT